MSNAEWLTADVNYDDIRRARALGVFRCQYNLDGERTRHLGPPARLSVTHTRLDLMTPHLSTSAHHPKRPPSSPFDLFPTLSSSTLKDAESVSLYFSILMGGGGHRLWGS